MGWLWYKQNVIESNRGKFGYFFEVDSKDFDFLKKIINYKFQTITYFGIDKIKLLNFLFRNKIKGVDRIVPIGSSLDIGFVWDGYDIDKMLTRVIDVQWYPILDNERFSTQFKRYSRISKK